MIAITARLQRCRGSVGDDVLQALMQALGGLMVVGERFGDGLERIVLQLAHQADGVRGGAVSLSAIPKDGPELVSAPALTDPDRLT